MALLAQRQGPSGSRAVPRPQQEEAGRRAAILGLTTSIPWQSSGLENRRSEAHIPGMATTVAVELLGVGIASRHHRRAFGDAEIGLPQPHPVLVGQAVEAFDRRMQQLGVGRKADVLGLHRGVDRDPLKVLAAQGSALMRYPQALTAVPVCRRAASSNGSGRSARAGTHAEKTPRQLSIGNRGHRPSARTRLHRTARKCT